VASRGAAQISKRAAPRGVRRLTHFEIVDGDVLLPFFKSEINPHFHRLPAGSTKNPWETKFKSIQLPVMVPCASCSRIQKDHSGSFESCDRGSRHQRTSGVRRRDTRRQLHGALIMTAVALRVEMKISIHVRLTDKRAAAEVVYVDPDQPRHCGIELERPENIWGLTLPPDDWREEETPRLIAP
jgi:hypothetical protein